MKSLLCHLRDYNYKQLFLQTLATLLHIWLKEMQAMAKLIKVMTFCLMIIAGLRYLYNQELSSVEVSTKSQYDDLSLVKSGICMLMSRRKLRTGETTRNEKHSLSHIHNICY